MSKVKLQDVADRLGVSAVTVSNALSGKSGVGDAMRKMIFETAQSMGYDTSRYQKAKSDELKIAVIVSEKYLEVGSSFYWTMYQQVAYASAQKGCFTMLDILENRSGSKKIPPAVLDREIDGVIVIGWMERERMDQLLSLVTVPVVLLDFGAGEIACDAVMSNNYLGMYKATRYLIENGHREIAFVGSVDANDNIMERYFGYRKALEEQGIKVRPDWVIPDRDLASNRMAVTLPKVMPTAFACNSDFSGGYLYDLLQKENYRVPDDISIVGYDNFLFGHPFAEQITTYNVDMRTMARAAVNLLLKRRKKPDKKIEIDYIDSDLVERTSVKKLEIAAF